MSNITNNMIASCALKLQESLFVEPTNTTSETRSTSSLVNTSPSAVVTTAVSPQASLVAGCYFLGSESNLGLERKRKRKMSEPALLLQLINENETTFSIAPTYNTPRNSDYFSRRVPVNSNYDDNEDVNIEDTILPILFGISLKRLKLIGNGEQSNYHSLSSSNSTVNHGGTGIDHQPGRFGTNNNNLGVHITQPASLPTSPVCSPGRPMSPIVSSTSTTASTVSTTMSRPNHNNESSVALLGFQRAVNSYNKDGGIDTASLCSLSTIATTSTAASIGSASWEAKSGIRERNAAMCNNDLMADVYFLVSNCPNSMMASFLKNMERNDNDSEKKEEEEDKKDDEQEEGQSQGESVDTVSISSTQYVRYPAHKYILAIGSSVFYAMFYGPLAETKEEIVVPDVEPAAFLKMLQYLYSDEIHLDEDTVLATLHVAKKYIIPQLAKACVSFMESSLTARNACLLLSQSRIFDEVVLMERCWEVIDAQAEKALNADGFLEIDHYTLESILSRETLNCKELTIFNAALQWANAECERRDIEPTPGNLRAALGNALQLIRVPTMELKEFADGPAQTGIFSLQESLDLFLHFTATNKPQVGYATTARAGLIPQICHRFQSSAYRNNQWRYRGRCDSIQFMVDRRIFIVGLGLYGSSGGAATYAVHIELKRQGRVLAENDTEFFSDGSSNTFHVYFDQPIQIDPEAYYTASATLDGLELSYFGQEGMTDVTVGAVTIQFQCSAESTNGTGVQGGQIPELIFYGPNLTNVPINTTTNNPFGTVSTINPSQN